MNTPEASIQPFFHAEPFRLVDHVEGRTSFHDHDTESAEASLLHSLQSSPEGTLLLIVFDGVWISSAAARRLLKRAMLRMRSGELADRFIVLGDLGDSQYNVQTMLVSESLTAVERTEDEGPRLLGIVDPAVKETYSYLASVDAATASMIQSRLQLNNISTATNRLTTLAKLGLARRVERRTVAGGGREYVYAAVQ